MVPKEINEYARGLYGKSPAPIDAEVLKKILGDGDVKIITHRPADDLEPQFDLYKEKYKDLVKSDEDVLTCALFEQVAVKFLENRNKVEEPKAEAKVEDEVIEVNLYIG